MSTAEALETPVKHLMTADEFWDFVHRPENEERNFELVRGEVVEMSRPNRFHGLVCSRINALLDHYAERVGWGFAIGNDSGVILTEGPSTVVGPDVAFFADVKTAAEIEHKWADTPPILAAEVLSPNDRMGKVNAKIQEYLRNGVKLIWLADSEDRTVSVYRPNRNLEVLKVEAEITGGEDLPGFSCKVADFFRLPSERSISIPSPPTSG